MANDSKVENSENKTTTRWTDATNILQQEFLGEHPPKRISPTAAAMLDDFHVALAADEKDKTNYSFDNAINKGVAIGKKDEIALELDMRDAMNDSTPNKRARAIVSAALGEFRLDSGTRLDLTSHADTKGRILQGLNYDFTGEATTFLRVAAGTLLEAQNDVDAHKGEVINGQPMNEEYKKQLHDEQQKVETKLDQIYGSHDIPSVFDQLEKVALNPETAPDLSKAILHMNNDFYKKPSPDDRLNGKRARDLALGFLVEASKFSKLNPTEGAAKVVFEESMKFLAKSEQLSDSKDNKALREIAAKVGSNIPSIATEAVKSSIESYIEKSKHQN